MSADLQTTQNGTCVTGRKYLTYFEYSTDQTCCKECIKVPLKSGEELSLTWNRLGGQGAGESAYVDTWMPGGASGVFSFLPRVNLESIPAGGQRVYSQEGSLSFAFTSPGTPQAQLPIASEKGTTYFTTYDQVTGVYFEYFGGDLATTDWRYGRVNRRYDRNGNVVQYNYTPNGTGEALLRSLSGDVSDNLVPSFHYDDETIDATHFAPVSRIFLEDQVDVAKSRTVYFEYTDYQDDVTLDTYPYLSRIIRPDGCTDQYDPIVPFNDITDVYQIKRDVDAEGFQTYFHYAEGILEQVAEPEGRITYYEYPTSSQTHQIQQGRPKRFLVNDLDAFGDQLSQVTKHTDPAGNTIYFEYDAMAARIDKKIDPNGNVTYYEYAAGAESEYAATRQVFLFNGAETYFGYDTKTYDPVKQVGPRWETGTNIEVTYWRYDANRNRTAQVDALGNTTLFGPDAEGRLIRQEDPRGNVTYFNYGAADGALESQQDALENITYFGYDSYRNRTAEVSPRWEEEGDFAAFTTYHEYDELNRRRKTIDAEGDVTYFDWTSRGNLLAEVDARGTETAHTYNGLRLRTKTTVTDLGGTKLAETLEGYDTFKNRVRTQDGLGNVTYFNYDDIDRMTSEVDALDQSALFFYDSVGNRTEEVDKRGNTTYFFYDLLSRTTVTRDALANPSYFFYDLADNNTVTRDARGNSSYFFYDALDRQESTRDALGNATYFFYGPAGNQTVTIDPRGNPTYFGYDAVNRSSQTQDALANVSYFEYDAQGNRVRMIDARENASTSAYDVLDRLQATADSLNNATYFFYDVVGNQTHIVDARRNASYFFYDGLQRQTATRDAIGNATYFFYDLTGNQTVTRNAREFSTYFGYDSLNRRNRVQDALSNTMYFEFDAVGNSDRVVDARGNSMRTGYDQLNREDRLEDALGNVTYFEYDAVGNQTVTLNARAFATYFGYDALNRQDRIQDALANTTYFEFDAAGNRDTMIDARGHSMLSGYDELNRQTRMEDALGNVTYFSYDSVGNQTSLLNPRGNASSFEYDALNRRTALQDPVGIRTLSEYDAVGNQTVSSRGVLGYGVQAYGTTPYGGSAGVTTYFFYDALNRQSAIRNPVDGVTYFFYDAVSNQTVVENPLAHSTYFGYDALNRQTRVQDALAATTYYEYDAVGNRTKVLDALDQATLTQFDELNRPSALEYPDTGVAYFVYDPVSNRVRDIDPRNNTTYYGYDAINRLVRVQDALARTTYFEYDGVSNLTKSIDAEGASAELTYDAINRQTDALYSASGDVVLDGLRTDPYYVYDEVGNVVQMGDLWGLHRMAYDAADRPVTHEFPNSDVVYFEYDGRSNLVTRVYPDGAGRESAVYDDLNRQIEVKSPFGVTTEQNYDAASNLVNRILGNDVTLRTSYDRAERLETWRWVDGSGAPLTYFDYTRNENGYITRAVREADHAVYYEYDENDRLLSEIWATVGGSPSEVYGYRYDYDLGGNRTKSRINGSDTYYFYDEASQLTVRGTNAVFATPTYYEYDQNGSLIRLIEPGGDTTFAYNVAGAVARIGWQDASFTYFYYDGTLNRYAIDRDGTVNYFLWDGMDILQQQEADGTVKEEYTNAKTFIPGIGQMVEVNRPSGSPQRIYPVMDPRGTITKWLEPNGETVVASREYDAFGRIIPNSESGTWPGTFGYQGQAWMEIESGDGSQRLLLSPSRLYDPTDGRFLSRDPMKLADSSRDVQLIQPAYSYVLGNPANLVDADGRFPMVWGTGGWTYFKSTTGLPTGWGTNTVDFGVPWGQPNVRTAITRPASTMVFPKFAFPSPNPLAFAGFGGGGTGGGLGGGFGAGGTLLGPNAHWMFNFALGGLAGLLGLPILGCSYYYFTCTNWFENRVTQRSWINKPINPGLTPLVDYPGWNETAFWGVYVGATLTFEDHGKNDHMDAGYRIFSSKTFRYCCEQGRVADFFERRRRSDVGKEGQGAFVPPPGVWFLDMLKPLSPTEVQFTWGFKGRPHPTPELGFQTAHPRTSKDIWHFVRGRFGCDGDRGWITIDRFLGSKFPSLRLFVDGVLVSTIPQGLFTDLWIPDGADASLVKRGAAIN